MPLHGLLVMVKFCTDRLLKSRQGTLASGPHVLFLPQQLTDYEQWDVSPFILHLRCQQ